MEPIFAWAEKVQLPILMHVNLIKYFDELVNVLERHPYLRICIPHLGLSVTFTKVSTIIIFKLCKAAK